MPKGHAISSPKQYRLFRAAASGKLRAAHGPSQSVAEKFLRETSHAKKSAFARAKVTVKRRGGY